MALDSKDPYKERLVQQCISILTTQDVLKEAYAQSEAVRQVVAQVMAGYHPDSQFPTGENISANDPRAGAAGAIVMGKEASHRRYNKHIPGI
jgi:hypothetical protein